MLIDMLFIPMRGCELDAVRNVMDRNGVIYPHEGL